MSFTACEGFGSITIPDSASSTGRGVENPEVSEGGVGAECPTVTVISWSDGWSVFGSSGVDPDLSGSTR